MVNMNIRIFASFPIIHAECMQCMEVLIQNYKYMHIMNTCTCDMYFSCQALRSIMMFYHIFALCLWKCMVYKSICNFVVNLTYTHVHVQCTYMHVLFMSSIKINICIVYCMCSKRYLMYKYIFTDKGEKGYQLKPEILRALTELFLVVENTALDWRMEQDLLVETITEESLSHLLEKVHGYYYSIHVHIL